MSVSSACNSIEFRMGTSSPYRHRFSLIFGSGMTDVAQYSGSKEANLVHSHSQSIKSCVWPKLYRLITPGHRKIAALIMWGLLSGCDCSPTRT